MLSGQATGLDKSGDGAVETIRMFKIAKDSAVKARTQAINQLKAVLVRADPTLRESLSGLGRVALNRACADLPSDTGHDTRAATTAVLRSLARRVLALTDEARALQQQMSATITACAPQLLEQHGVGPDTAAALLITAGDNPDRLANQATFAALCGVNPIEASSGKTTRRRLNRGGDRRANSALYTIVLTRLGRNPRTRDYATKRAREGKSTKEIIRCLKRYVARQIFPLITAALSPATTPNPAA
ncbi:transposase [Micromonospora sp. LOL_024]|uniref:transposase n=1 Tax=Micromonospora sp. LOL_024 TaxID=3345412 RepID=UPI003A8BDC16